MFLGSYPDEHLERNIVRNTKEAKDWAINSLTTKPHHAVSEKMRIISDYLFICLKFCAYIHSTDLFNVATVTKFARHIFHLSVDGGLCSPQ